ncbi:MAG: hypothetical protein ACFFCQ_01695 [Promethearchaeota archaeon]
MPEIQRCEECQGEIIQTTSDLVCSNCGLIISPVFVEPLLPYNDDNESTLVSYGVSQGFRLHIADSLGSFVGTYGNWRLRDGKGKSLSPFQYEKFSRLKKLNDIFLHTTSFQKKEYRGLRILNAVGATLEIPESVRSESCYLLRKALKDPTLKSTVLELVAGSLYLAIRITKVTVRLQDIISAFEQRGHIIEGKKLLKAAVGIKKLTGKAIQPTRAEDFINKAIEAICLSSKVKTSCAKRSVPIDQFRCTLRIKTRDLLKSFPPNRRGGRNPYIFVCAMLVAADKLLAKENNRPTILTQRLVAQECQVAEYSLREHYLKLIKPRFLTNSVIFS